MKKIISILILLIVLPFVSALECTYVEKVSGLEANKITITYPDSKMYKCPYTFVMYSHLGVLQPQDIVVEEKETQVVEPSVCETQEPVIIEKFTLEGYILLGCMILSLILLISLFFKIYQDWKREDQNATTKEKETQS